MLQVKNSKQSNRWLAIGLTVLCTVLFGCKPNDPSDPVGPDVKPGTTENPNWAVTVENDMTASMAAIVKISFTDKQGTLAAFIGNDCCAVTTDSDYVEGLYFLYISPAANNSSDVQLRFYSPDLKRIFNATSTFPFVNDGLKGSVTEPYIPEWKIAE